MDGREESSLRASLVDSCSMLNSARLN